MYSVKSRFWTNEELSLMVAWSSSDSISHFKVQIFTALCYVKITIFPPMQWFRNKTAFLFETSQSRISLFECWDESSGSMQSSRYEVHFEGKNDEQGPP